MRGAGMSKGEKEREELQGYMASERERRQKKRERKREKNKRETKTIKYRETKGQTDR